MPLKSAVRTILQKRGYVHVRSDENSHVLDDAFLAHDDSVKNEPLTSMERVQSLYEAVRLIPNRQVSGATEESGVWRGRSAMLCAGRVAIKA